MAAAIELARQRGTWPSSPARLLEAFGQFDEPLADRVMEESLTFRSVERSVDEVLLPALVMAGERVSWEAESQFAFHWATGWLFAARRASPHSDHAQAVVLLDSSTHLSVDSLRVQALELGLRRASMHTVLLRCALPAGRVTSALRRIDPMALVICGGSRGSTVERLEHAVKHADCDAPLYELAESEANGERTLGPGALEATRQLRASVKRAELRPRANGRRQHAA